MAAWRQACVLPHLLLYLRIDFPWQLIVGTKSGAVELYDVASSSLLESIDKAHDGPIWSIHVRPDGKGFVSGSADQNVKFWDFKIKEVKAGVSAESTDKPAVSKVLSLVHIRTLKMTDDILSVRFSPDGRLIAVALLDFTVKVFFQDTMKFFLSLYGHKVRFRVHLRGLADCLISCPSSRWTSPSTQSSL